MLEEIVGLLCLLFVGLPIAGTVLYWIFAGWAAIIYTAKEAVTAPASSKQELKAIPREEETEGAGANGGDNHPDMDDTNARTHASDSGTEPVDHVPSAQCYSGLDEMYGTDQRPEDSGQEDLPELNKVQSLPVPDENTGIHDKAIATTNTPSTSTSRDSHKCAAPGDDEQLGRLLYLGIAIFVLAFVGATVAGIIVRPASDWDQEPYHDSQESAAGTADVSIPADGQTKPHDMRDPADAMFTLVHKEAVYWALRNVDRPFDAKLKKAAIRIPPEDNTIADVVLPCSLQEDGQPVDRLFFIIFENLASPDPAKSKEDLACVLVNLDGSVLERDEEFWNRVPDEAQRVFGAVATAGPPSAVTVLLEARDLMGSTSLSPTADRVPAATLDSPR